MGKIIATWLVKVVARTKDELDEEAAATVAPITNAEIEIIVAEAVAAADANLAVTASAERTDI